MRINHIEKIMSDRIRENCEVKVEDQSMKRAKAKQICIPVVNPGNMGMLKCPGCGMLVRIKKEEQ